MTPHISAQPGEISDRILLPGDPLRAKYIADNYLEDPVQFNAVRNMLGYTGYYNDMKISVMGTGMGIPSISIYATELIRFYDVKKLIRVGSAGALQPNIRLGDVIISAGASHTGDFARQFDLSGHVAAIPDPYLLNRTILSAINFEISHHIGQILSSDYFYHDDPAYWKNWARLGVMAVEMETYALYLIAAIHRVSALSICTISDHLITGESMDDIQREKGLNQMIKIALESICFD